MGTGKKWRYYYLNPKYLQKVKKNLFVVPYDTLEQSWAKLLLGSVKITGWCG